VIIDLTGVDMVDAATADHIVRLARAVQLIGSRCILTGIGTRVAGALAALGVGLEGITTMRSLKDGLRYCLSQRRR